jgi:hypothetical protein
MEYNPYEYPRIVTPSENGYTNIFFDRRDLRKYIPFTYNINAPIHRWFYFEHGFSSKLIDILLSEVKATSENILYDPFCGIGTAPVTSTLKGIPSVGSDISPFCVFVTNTKLRALSQVDYEELREVMKQFSKTPLSPPSASTHESMFTSLFSKNVFREILSIRELIKNIPESRVKDLCKLALLSIVEQVSRNIRNGAAVRHPPVQLFISKLSEMRDDLLRILSEKIKSELPNSLALVGDAREIVLKDNVDLVITSPPYLDFYDYTQMYEREHALFFVSSSEELQEIRQNSIRSHIKARFAKSSSYRPDILNQIVDEIHNLDHKRLAYDYFADMWFVFMNLSKIVAHGGFVFFIVENVEYSNIVLEVDTILLEIAKENGFNPEGILVTNLHKNNRRDSIVVITKS